MSRAVSIRSQLKKYMQRFNLPLESCQGDAKRLRRCLVSGYWRNGARWIADGTYRSVRGNKVRICFNCGYMSNHFAGFARASHISAVHEKASIRLGHISRNGRNKKDPVGQQYYMPFFGSSEIRIRIITEIEPDWLVPLPLCMFKN